MKRFLSVVLACLLIVAAIPVMAEEAVVSGAVAEIEKYGHARLDITIEDFERAGFALGGTSSRCPPVPIPGICLI